MVTAIVLAAGRSTRMGGDTNKQFLSLLDKPVLWYALNAFEQCAAVNQVVVVRRPDWSAMARDLVERYSFAKVCAYADGGIERQNSVWNGLAACSPATEIVAVHDGARPLVTPGLITATVASARQHGTGIAATKIVDTIKEISENLTVARTVDRTRLWAVQTPQTVRYRLLCEAYQKVLEDKVIVTDEAAAVERLGHEVHLVSTPFLNLKVTTPDDLPMIRALLRELNT